MREVFRYDRGSILKRSPRATDEGFRMLSGVMAKAGVMPYRQADGTILWELVPEDELLDAESLGTLGLKPVTTEHPDGNVTPKNARNLADGVVSPKIRAVRTAEGGYVDVDLIVLVEDALDSIDDGKHELSPGYRCRLDFTPGADKRYARPDNPEGRWDAIQRGRRYNHLAIVDAARGGPDVRLHLDAAIQVRDPVGKGDDHAHADHPLDTPETPMLLTALVTALAAAGVPTEGMRSDAAADAAATPEDIRKAFELTAKHADGKAMGVAFDAVATTLDKAMRDMAKMQEAMDLMAKERDEYKAKLTEMEEMTDHGDSAPSHADLIAWRADRAAAEALVEKYGVQVENADTVDNAGLRRAVAKSIVDDLADDADEATVNSIIAVAAKLQPGRKDSVTIDPYADAFRYEPRERVDADDSKPTLTASEASLAALRGESTH